MHRLLIAILALSCGVGSRALLAQSEPLRPSGEAPAAAVPPGAVPSPGADPLDEAQYLFYSGRYEEAAAIARGLRETDPDSLATYELRTSALHLQMKRAMGGAEGKDRDKLFKACDRCPNLLADFLEEMREGRTKARAAVERDPQNPISRYYLGKIDLNYIWLRLSTMGQRTGWNEYWEARHSLDDALKLDPEHLRARVARAGIEYIVDTRTPGGFGGILGGGSKKRGLAMVREAAAADSPRFDHAEAVFALWEMEQREKNLPAAIEAARGLARQFPDNREVARFLARHADAP
jgi:tetratricopeptide (TPR) repeat protein